MDQNFSIYLIFVRKILTPKENFFSWLNNEGISNWMYKHAKRVWNVFNMKEKYDYVYLHNMQNVLKPLARDIDLSVKFNSILCILWTLKIQGKVL